MCERRDQGNISRVLYRWLVREKKTEDKTLTLLTNFMFVTLIPLSTRFEHDTLLKRSNLDHLLVILIFLLYSYIINLVKS